MINPLWLRTFRTLVDTGHFTKTAEKLFMTQPGVSQHITKLEDACDCALIKRDKKRFDVTEQGRLVYQYACQLDKSEEVLREQLVSDDPYAGKCRLACSGSLALMLYPKLLDLQCQHSQLILEVKAAPNQQILNEVQQGKVDIGIVTHIPNPALFDVETIGHEQLCLVLPATVNLAKVYRSDLLELGLISHPDAEHYLSLFFAQNSETCFDELLVSDIPVSGSINQIGQILEPVAKGLGFTVLPKSAIDSFHAPEKIMVFEAKTQVIETLHLVVKKGRNLPARFDTVSRKLQAHFNMSTSGS
ncbi:LysR family transcriptional regulator [Litorilituus lipolyticus]|uniref:LysR family transcriptional regulator n=1 Tax=Litorilituus lipolyticus TaxID=2491017 RepID=A0A502L7M3_9GAMM|nr:LysR family transcriptional regulator [Litorilituus lipolyticus]TPH18113.1 LysR family transcriptional regulator [Litorilituus lipolyticus]